MPDLVYTITITIVLVLALLTHLPSFCLIVRDFKGPNNVNLIYRHLFMADSILMLVYIPLNIYWTLARNNQLLCKIMKANLFLVFFAACNLLIILAVDRSVS